MKSSALIRAAGLVALGICSLVVTRSLIAQKPKPKPSPRTPIASAQQAPGGVAGREAMTKARVHAPPPGPEEPGFSMLDIRTKDGVLDIAAQKNLLLTGEPYCSYMWSVSIWDTKTQALVRKTDYVEQMFSLETGVLRKVTFHDRFDLEPGDYSIGLVIYRVRPGVDPTTITNDTRNLEYFSTAWRSL